MNDSHYSRVEGILYNFPKLKPAFSLELAPLMPIITIVWKLKRYLVWDWIEYLDKSCCNEIIIQGNLAYKF